MDPNRYQQCLTEMYGLRRFGIILGLDIIRGMLENLDNPQHQFLTIHIAGTNGKGSIASAIANIIFHAGYRVGLYTSPHLIRFNERIRINNEEISDHGVVAAYEAAKKAHHGEREATFFEYTTAMALYAFAAENVDWAVVETGMGGRLDATNVLEPQISIISNISMEHRDYLGPDIAAIAGEKAGIIKPRTPVITGARQKAAVEVIRQTANARSAPFYRIGEHFRVRRNPGAGTFTYYGIDHVWPNMQTRLSGNHQIDNAAIVLAACEILSRNTSIDFTAIRAGLKTHHWPGRLEMRNTRPRILIDGAHNLMAARHLARFLKEQMADRKITLVIGILDDKPYRSMLQSILPQCCRAVFTRPGIDRSLPAETLAQTGQDLIPDFDVISDVAEAVAHAYRITEAEDLICIAGSLYVVGEASAALDEMRLRA
ncbi:MAG: bifunctional folylpolyglutamate synthase/dihydrofolate synthase [Desulfobacterales bacterium]